MGAETISLLNKIFEWLKRIFPSRKVHTDLQSQRNIRDTATGETLVSEKVIPVCAYDVETGEFMNFGTWAQPQVFNNTATFNNLVDYNAIVEFNDDVVFNDPVVINDTLNVNDGAMFDEGIIVNESGGDNDTRIEGATEPNLFFLDAGNNRIGIGTITPDSLLDMESEEASGVRAKRFSGATAASRPIMGLYRARGTRLLPVVVQNNDYIGSFSFYGYDGAAFQLPATIDAFVDGVPALGSVPARLSLVTGANFATRAERLSVDSSGNVRIEEQLRAVKDVIMNSERGDNDVQIKGDIDNYNFFSDASTDRIGIGTNTPSKKFDVDGDISLEAGTGDYYSNDGSPGWTGTFNNVDGDIVTVKNGIITNVG